MRVNGQKEACVVKSKLQKNMLSEIMKLQFALIDNALYLDTHPNDQQALLHHNRMHYQLKMQIQEYEYKYEPLTIYGKSDYCWTWINSPWPWEIDY